MRFFETVTDLCLGEELLARRSYGVIEMAEGVLQRVRFRPYPKIISSPEIALFGNRFHRKARGDRLWLYYNQPRRFSNFLVLKYVVSSRETSLGSLVRALDLLDYIARLKGSDALLCEAANWRVSTELIARWGWTPHCPSRWHRHYIKRFYGVYPEPAKWIAEPVPDYELATT
jgi:hypothetical protein